MTQITTAQYELLVNEIYNSIMGNPDMGMGEMGEARDEGKRIVEEWMEKTGITFEATSEERGQDENDDKEIEELEKDLWNQPTGAPPTPRGQDTEPAKELKKVPRWLQIELSEISTPVMDKYINLMKRENQPFTRFALQSIAEQLVCHGYFHAIPNPPENKNEEAIGEQPDWKYSPHFKDDAQGHIFSKDENRMLFNLVAPAATTQKQLNKDANKLISAVNAYPALVKENQQLKEQLETRANQYAEKVGEVEDLHLQATASALKAIVAERLLHDLTPGGSEFYGDPQRCAKWIKENRDETHSSLAGIIKKEKQKNEKQAKDIEFLRGTLLAVYTDIQLNDVYGGSDELNVMVTEALRLTEK